MPRSWPGSFTEASDNAIMMLNWLQATLLPKDVTSLGGVKVISAFCGPCCTPVLAPSHLLLFMSCRSWLWVTLRAPRSRAYGLPQGNSWEILETLRTSPYGKWRLL